MTHKPLTGFTEIKPPSEYLILNRRMSKAISAQLKEYAIFYNWYEDNSLICSDYRQIFSLKGNDIRLTYTPDKETERFIPLSTKRGYGVSEIFFDEYEIETKAFHNERLD